MSQHGCPERLSNRSKGFQEDGPSQQTMEVLVETLTGTAFEMTVSPSDTIFAIKSKIFRVEGIPVSQQHLVYNLRELQDAWSLQEVGIGDGARLRLVLGMRGGPISTRRLPPPPAAAAAASEPWRDIETLLDSNREDGEWGSGGGGSGWKVTVLVFRDGDRVNMLRVRENHDGTYSPLALALDHNKSSSTSSLNAGGSGGGSGSGSVGVVGSVQENAVTMGKMMALRRRMEDLSVLRRPLRPDNNDKADIQKTRSEETLSVPSLLDEPVDAFKHRTYTPYAEEDSFAPLYDGNYTRYDYDCSFADRYTLLPPIGTRTDSDQSVQEAVADSERLNVSEAVPGLVEAGVEVSPVPAAEPRRPARPRAPLPAADYGPVVCGSVGVGGGVGGVGVGVGVGAWGGVGLGLGLAGAVSASSLHAPPHAHAHTHAHAHPHAHAHGSSRPAPPRAHRPKLSDALFSSSTSDLDNLKRNSRILPALSRHRNREHLHLSDEGLHLHHHTTTADHTPPPPPPPASTTPPPASTTPPPPDTAPAAPPAPAAPAAAGDGAESAAPAERKVRVRCGLCRKRLSIATVHRCRCGAEFCAPHRYAEVHGCLYDYKHAHHAHILRVQAPKLPKI